MPGKRKLQNIPISVSLALAWMGEAVYGVVGCLMVRMIGTDIGGLGVATGYLLQQA